MLSSFSAVFGYNLFMFMGIKIVLATRAGIVYALLPMLAWVAAWIVLKEGSPEK